MKMLKIDISGDSNIAQCRVCLKHLEFVQKDEFEIHGRLNRQETRTVQIKSNKQQVIDFAERHHDLHFIKGIVN